VHSGIRTVVKIGGGLLARADCLGAVLAEVAAATRESPLLVVPGGGPFADTIRDVDRRLGLTDDAAHWMAVLAMDQYAHFLVSRMPSGELVVGARDAAAVLEARRIPVLAPYRWMREADPLPHSWDVTSDSISAWVAGQVGAPRLVLVKPAGASGAAVLDPCFHRVLSIHVKAETVTADRIAELRKAIAAHAI
jgi:5-(aminomethyl)-3-furanmethanol phosphate kinase